MESTIRERERRLIASPALEPLAVSDELHPVLESLDLLPNVAELRDQGYTVVRDAADSDFSQQLEAAIKRLANHHEEPAMGVTAMYTLGYDPVFRDALLKAKVTALVEFSCGRGALLASMHGSVRPRGCPPLFLHADAATWFASPFPERNHHLTICWPTRELDGAGGATKVVPRSHLLRRNPSAQEIEREENAVPIEIPLGGFGAWLGSTWHGNYPRVSDGERVMLHITYLRLNLRSPTDWTYLGPEFLNSQDERIRTLLGLEDRFGKDRPGAWTSREYQLRTYENLKT